MTEDNPTQEAVGTSLYMQHKGVCYVLKKHGGELLRYVVECRQEGCAKHGELYSLRSFSVHSSSTSGHWKGILRARSGQLLIDVLVSNGIWVPEMRGSEVTPSEVSEAPARTAEASFAAHMAPKSAKAGTEHRCLQVTQPGQGLAALGALYRTLLEQAEAEAGVKNEELKQSLHNTEQELQVVKGDRDAIQGRLAEATQSAAGLKRSLVEAGKTAAGLKRKIEEILSEYQ